MEGAPLPVVERVNVFDWGVDRPLLEHSTSILAESRTIYKFPPVTSQRQRGRHYGRVASGSG